MDVRLMSAGVLAAVAALVVLMATAPPERIAIVVAGSDLPAGVPIGELDLESRDVESAVGLIAFEEVGELGECTPVGAGSGSDGFVSRIRRCRSWPIASR
jgi:hypothetical protein